MTTTLTLYVITLTLFILAAVCVAIILMQHEQIKDLNQYIKDLIQGLNK